MEREMKRSGVGKYGEKEGGLDSLVVLLFFLSVKTGTSPNQELETCFHILPHVPWGAGRAKSLLVEKTLL